MVSVNQNVLRIMKKISTVLGPWNCNNLSTRLGIRRARGLIGRVTDENFRATDGHTVGLNLSWEAPSSSGESLCPVSRLAKSAFSPTDLEELSGEGFATLSWWWTSFRHTDFDSRLLFFFCCMTPPPRFRSLRGI